MILCTHTDADNITTELYTVGGSVFLRRIDDQCHLTTMEVPMGAELDMGLALIRRSVGRRERVAPTVVRRIPIGEGPRV